jgi:hypothetical protein
MNKLNCQLAICPNTWGHSHGHVGDAQMLYQSREKNTAKAKENLKVCKVKE